MRDEIMVQVQETGQGVRAGERVVIPKGEVIEIQEAESWVMGVYHVRWYLAARMGLAVALMSWSWLEREEFGTWMSNTWDFAKLLVPLLFGGVFVVGFISALLPVRPCPYRTCSC